jgi:hypothetical protein
VSSGYAVLAAEPVDVIGYSCLCVHSFIHPSLRMDKRYALLPCGKTANMRDFRTVVLRSARPRFHLVTLPT